jgi:hypothetical protein
MEKRTLLTICLLCALAALVTLVVVPAMKPVFIDVPPPMPRTTEKPELWNQGFPKPETRRKPGFSLADAIFQASGAPQGRDAFLDDIQMEAEVWTDESDLAGGTYESWREAISRVHTTERIERRYQRSHAEKMLFTEYRKWISPHFFLETSFDANRARDLISFLETAYAEFLKWALKSKGYDLWRKRVHVIVIYNRAEWECLIKGHLKGKPIHEVAGIIKTGFYWCPDLLLAWHYSRDGSTPESDKIALFHTLNHLFLNGLASSGREGIVWWLWEGFAFHRSLEIFHSRGPTCGREPDRKGGRGKDPWADVDDWVSLLKRDVRTKQDEDFVIFAHKDPWMIQTKTYVKAWSLVRYLVRDIPNKRKFIGFVEGIETEGKQSGALAESFDLVPDRRDPTAFDKIDREWRAWIKRQPSRWRKHRRR